MVIKENYDIVENIKKVRTLMNLVWQILVQAKLLNAIEKIEERIDNFCDFHTVCNHTLQTCKEFRTMVQRMMNKGSIKFYDEKQTPYTEFANATPSTNALEEEKANLPYGIGKPLILYDN